jgi:hypothetical protein
MGTILGQSNTPKFYRNFAKDNVLNYPNEPYPITFTRSTTATYYNGSGLLVSASINQPRFDYDPYTLESKGLYMEESRTNINYPSIPTATYTGSTTLNYAIAPDGTQTATRYQWNSQGNVYYYGNSSTNSTSSYYTVSAYVKANNNGSGSLKIVYGGSDGANQIGLTVITYPSLSIVGTNSNLAVITNSGSMNISNGWYRVWATGQITGSISNAAFGLFALSSNNDVLVWGAQVEVGRFPTSYIPTTNATVNRAADFAYISNTSTLMSPDGTHTWYVEFRGGNESNQNGYGRILSMGGNEIVGTEGGGGSVPITMTTVGSYNGNSLYNSIGITSNINFWTTFGKAATYWNASTFDWYIASQGLLNKSRMSSNPSFQPSTYNVYIGGTQGGNNMSNGWIKQVKYFPKQLDGNYLKSITI